MASNCCKCSRQVYIAEAISYQEKVYHKTCFKCTECDKKLELNKARSFNKLPYCNYHSPETNKKLSIPPANECHDTTKSLFNSTTDDKSSVPIIKEEPIQNHTNASSDSTSIARTNITLASGYETFKSQIELASQVFTVDPVVRRNIFEMFTEFNIIVCGSARVGKSSLINAICNRPLAKTSSGLDSCTKDISRYVLSDKCYIDDQLMTYTYNFWDTPGFESWNEIDIRINFDKIMKKPKSDPLCMIYCASPGSFADTQQVKWLLDVCIRDHKLLCALVVTNKWAGQKSQRLAILDKYKELLANYNPQTSEEDGITYFGNVGLCTMLNTLPYIDEDQGIHQQQQGIDELIEGIMTCLDDDGKIFHWCMAVMEKKGFTNTFKGRMLRRFDNIKDFFVKRFSKSGN